MGSTIKKGMVTILAIAILLVSYPQDVFAKENLTLVKEASHETLQKESSDVLSLEKDNFNYLEGKPGDTHLVYTYDSNGSTYKVTENASKNFDEVNSTIYIENSDEVFVKFATQHFTVNNSVLTLKTNENGEITTEIQNLTTEKSNLLSVPVFQSLRETYKGYKVTNWNYIDVTKSSTKFERYTTTAVVAALTFLVSGGSGVLTGTASTAIGAVAGLVVGDEIPLLYYSRYYYDKKLVNPPVALKNFVVASKWVTYFYSDKKHSHAIGGKVTDIVY